MTNIRYRKLYKIALFGLILLFPCLSFAQVPLDLAEAHPTNIDSFGGFGQRAVPIHKNVEQKLAPVRRHARFELFDVEFDTSNGKPRLASPQPSRANQLVDVGSLKSNIVVVHSARNQDLSKTLNMKPKPQYFKSKKQRHFMPVDELVAKQFQRVMKTAEKLNIIKQKDKFVEPIIIASPSGSHYQGSISQLMRNPENKGINGYKLRRGPYEDAFHTQIMNDFDAVSSMLGSSVKEKHEPTMNEVLSQIMLRENWDIFRL